MPPNAEDLQYLLGQMNAKLDTLISRTDEDRKTVEKLSARVSELEAFRWKLLGAASLLGGLAGLLPKFLQLVVR